MALDRRQKLQRDLEAVPGVKKVYFQPPATVKMIYPAIRYNREGGRTNFAGDMPYTYSQRYTLTVITCDPDSDIPEYIATHFAMCTLDRTYVVDNLYHSVFTIYR